MSFGLSVNGASSCGSLASVARSQVQAWRIGCFCHAFRAWALHQRGSPQLWQRPSYLVGAFARLVLVWRLGVFRTSAVHGSRPPAWHLTIRSTRTRLVPPTTWQVELAMLLDPLRRSG